MTVKNAPATALPWPNDDQTGGTRLIRGGRDAMYARHAANAYPRLVISVENSVAIIGMLLDHVPLAQRAALLDCMNERRALLRSLGEV